MLLRLFTSLIILPHLVFAAPCLPFENAPIRGELKSGEKACFILNASANELLSLKLDSSNPQISLTVQTPQGEEITQAQTGGHQKLWKSQRFLTKTQGMYRLTVQTLDQSPSQFQLGTPERLTAAQYYSELDKFDLWLKNNAIALNDKTAFEQLDPHLANARLIGIGEASHGNREFWDTRTDIVLHLARQQKMRVVALEISPYIGRRMDSFVRNLDQTTQKQIVSEIGNPMFSTEGMWDFLQALRTYNNQQNPEQQIRIVGVDIHPGRDEDHFLQQFLQKVAPEIANLGNELMSDQTAKAILHKTANERRAELNHVGTTLEQQFIVHQQQWIAVSSSHEYAQALIALHARIGALNTLHLPWQQSMPSRDRYMHRNIMTLLQAETAAHPVTFLAHDMHISASTDFYAGRFVGSLLKESLGNAYIAIGTAFDQGSVLALKIGTNRPQVFNMGPSMPQSLGHYLSRSASSYYAIPMTAATQGAAPLLNSPLKMRIIPLDSGEQIADLQYETIVPARDFDVLIFKKQVSADLSLTSPKI
ncbi:erythromycin esterase family protein [Chitinibacter sp. S2-10]|uniref:erythromycin esterase family protein n=1 Tax=Chitinibacter sp. S2-10 TaxID=3373597 RepID=UPI00397763E3